VKKALTYPLKLIAENAGTNGSVVMQRVIDSQDPNYGYNAAIDKFEDLMQTGIIDPTKVRWGLGFLYKGGGECSAGFAAADVLYVGWGMPFWAGRNDC
jgi:hypothetical protein